MAFLHDGSPSSDILQVGRRKAVGYVNFSDTPKLRFLEHVDLDAIIAELAVRKIETRLFRRGAHWRYRKEIDNFCKALPPVLCYGKPAEVSWTGFRGTPELYAFDRDTLESFLECNKEILRGYPTNADAFIELLARRTFSEKTDLYSIIVIAFGYRPASLYERGERARKRMNKPAME